MGGIPEEENQSKGQTKEASSWLPKRLVHGMFLSRVGEIALSQNKLAFWIAMLLAVTTSPKYTTKSVLLLQNKTAMLVIIYILTNINYTFDKSISLVSLKDLTWSFNVKNFSHDVDRVCILTWTPISPRVFTEVEVCEDCDLEP